ncbi:UNVERIFIED_CONTAM: hypothetical protein RMT77_003581 [Armadillidium vulgare]
MREEDCKQVPQSRNVAGTSQSLPPAILTPEPSYPYDAWVMAGGRLFRAHSQILGNHSPYLRASINSLREPRLLLPHIPAGGFAAVLSYMYTGRITLTQAPIYEILITAHILQMPAIVALCQTLLTTSQISSSEIMRQTFSIEDITEDKRLRISYSDRPLPEALSAWRSLAQLVPTSMSKDRDKANSTLIRPTPTRPMALVAEEKAEPPNSDGHHSHLDFSHSMKDVPFRLTSESPSPSLNDKDGDERQSVGRFSSVVLDVAACDGPVFFERVINKAFKAGNESDPKCFSGSDSESSESEINVVDTADDDTNSLSESFSLTPSFMQRLQPNLSTTEGGSRTYHCVYCNNNFKSHYCYQKHMRRHINPITAEQTENITQTKEADISNTTEEKPDEESAIPTSSGTKRGYFYSKNDRNLFKRKAQLSENDSGSGSESQSSTSGGSISSVTTGTKLKVLDLNVQYFPCKTCGSKFPSYYFVHKHRRLCHNEEEPPEKGKNISLATSSTSPAKQPITSVNGSINTTDTMTETIAAKVKNSC